MVEVSAPFWDFTIEEYLLSTLTNIYTHFTLSWLLFNERINNESHTLAEMSGGVNLEIASQTVPWTLQLKALVHKGETLRTSKACLQKRCKGHPFHLNALCYGIKHCCVIIFFKTAKLSSGNITQGSLFFIIVKLYSHPLIQIMSTSSCSLSISPLSILCL